MAIEIRHGVNASSALAAAAGGAQGQARQRGAIGAAQAATAIQQQRTALAAQERASQLGFERGLERMRLNTELQTQAAESAQERRRADLEFSLTTKQRVDLENLAQAEADAMASNEFTPEEKAELRKRFAQRRAGIQPVEKPRPKTPAEIFGESTYTDPKSGYVYAIENGALSTTPLYKPPERQMTWKDRNDALKQTNELRRQAIDYATVTNPETGAKSIDQNLFNAYMSRVSLPGGPQDQGFALPPPVGAEADPGFARGVQGAQRLDPGFVRQPQMDAAQQSAAIEANRAVLGNMQQGGIGDFMEAGQAFGQPVPGTEPYVDVMAPTPRQAAMKAAIGGLGREASLADLNAAAQKITAAPEGVDLNKPLDVVEINDLATAQNQASITRLRVSDLRRQLEKIEQEEKPLTEGQARSGRFMTQNARSMQNKAIVTQQLKDAEERLKAIQEKESGYKDALQDIEGRKRAREAMIRKVRGLPRSANAFGPAQQQPEPEQPAAPQAASRPTGRVIGSPRDYEPGYVNPQEEARAQSMIQGALRQGDALRAQREAALRKGGRGLGVPGSGVGGVSEAAPRSAEELAIIDTARAYNRVREEIGPETRERLTRKGAKVRVERAKKKGRKKKGGK